MKRRQRVYFRMYPRPIGYPDKDENGKIHAPCEVCGRKISLMEDSYTVWFVPIKFPRGKDLRGTAEYVYIHEDCQAKRDSKL